MDDHSTGAVAPIYIVRDRRLAARRVAGEMVILSADDSSLYVLNEVGTLLWEAADGVTPLREIVDRVVCAAFEVDLETGVHDARQFLDELSSHGIIHLSAAPIATNPTGGAADEVTPWAR